MVPPSSDRISRVPPYSRIHEALRVRGCHPLRPAFPDRSAYLPQTTGLLRVRSPLLAESLLMSFPPGTEMFQFPGFASPPYVFRWRYPKGVGCPIRIPTDQRLLAAPRGFSQRATSFIASWCQGIHRMPFLYSISRTTLRRTPPHHAQKPSSGYKDDPGNMCFPHTQHDRPGRPSHTPLTQPVIRSIRLDRLSRL